MDYLHVVGYLLLPVLHLQNWVSAQNEIHAPCYSCVFYKLHHQQQPQPQRHKSADGACTFPCLCDVHILKCGRGVNVIQDGCGCCNICARQQGQACNRRLRCDEKKGLFCNMDNADVTSGNPKNGTCMVRAPKSCRVNGVEYEHGEQFNPNCSLLCTCHNGRHGCVSLCPQEERPPGGTCAHPQLTPVPDQCCREWTCDPVTNLTTLKPATDLSSNLASDAISNDRPVPTIRLSDTDYTRALLQVPVFRVPGKNCQINTTAWSPCSVSCGVGLSVRMTTDLTTCQTVQQSQVCFVRPCDMTELYKNVDHGHGNCTPTVKSRQMHSIVYDGCHSLETKHFRFCGFCGETSCCLPRKIKTVMMEFDCGGGKRRVLNVMWIRKCHCIKNCSPNHPF